MSTNQLNSKISSFMQNRLLSKNQSWLEMHSFCATSSFPFHSIPSAHSFGHSAPSQITSFSIPRPSLLSIPLFFPGTKISENWPEFWISGPATKFVFGGNLNFQISIKNFPEDALSEQLQYHSMNPNLVEECDLCVLENGRVFYIQWVLSFSRISIFVSRPKTGKYQKCCKMLEGRSNILAHPHLLNY